MKDNQRKILVFLVEKATGDYYRPKVNEELGNYINKHPGQPNIGARVAFEIKRRLDRSKPLTALLAVKLIEDLLEQVSTFHVHVASKKFLSKLKSLLKQQKNTGRGLFRRASDMETLKILSELEQKVLSLISVWKDHYDSDKFPQFKHIYVELSLKGWTFPQSGVQLQSVQTNQDQVNEKADEAPAEELKEENEVVIIHEHVAYNIHVLDGMARQLEKAIARTEYTEATPLVNHIRQVQSELRGSQGESDADVLQRMIMLNEELVTIQQRYYEVLSAMSDAARRKAAEATSTSEANSTATGAAAPQATPPSQESKSAPPASDTSAAADSQEPAKQEEEEEEEEEEGEAFELPTDLPAGVQVPPISSTATPEAPAQSDPPQSPVSPTSGRRVSHVQSLISMFRVLEGERTQPRQINIPV